MRREKIDFTDKELYYVALAIESFIYNRETWLNVEGRNAVNRVIRKVVKNGKTRKNPQSIIHPLHKEPDDN